MANKLIKGNDVTINIPFTYTVGEKGVFTNKIIKTIEDAKAEVIAEINAGVLDIGEIHLTCDSKNNDQTK